MASFAKNSDNDSDDDDDEEVLLGLNEAVSLFTQEFFSTFSYSLIYFGVKKVSADNLEWDPCLEMNQTDFTFGNERLIFLPDCGDVIISKTEFECVICDELIPPSFHLKRLQIRTSKSGHEAFGNVAFVLEDDTSHNFLMVVHIGESDMLRLLVLMKHSLALFEGGSVQLYRTPAETVVKKDKWWNKKYPGSKNNKNIIDALDDDKEKDQSKHPYTAYREVIDYLIVDKIDSLIQQSLFGTSPIYIAELCGGDGTLAAHVLPQLDNLGLLGGYAILERNKVLLDTASKLLPTSNWGEKLQLISVDTALENGQDLIGTLDPRPNIWIASGSTLNGQVGSAAMVEPTLVQMGTALCPGGFMIITGYSTTYLTPTMIARAQLIIRHASMPSSQAGGLETDCGLFHMWVLEKPIDAESEGEREPAAAEAN